jgi:hypothetical protein
MRQGCVKRFAGREVDEWVCPGCLEELGQTNLLNEGGTT